MTDESESPLLGQKYRSVFTLYSKNGKRSADILEFQNGEIYLDEKEWLAGTTFKNRHTGRLVGPFASPAEAERFIVTTPWFRGTRIEEWVAKTLRRPLVLTLTIVLVLIAGLTAASWFNDRTSENVVCKEQMNSKYNGAKADCE